MQHKTETVHLKTDSSAATYAAIEHTDILIETNNRLVFSLLPVAVGLGRFWYRGLEQGRFPHERGWNPVVPGHNSSLRFATLATVATTAIANATNSGGRQGRTISISSGNCARSGRWAEFFRRGAAFCDPYWNTRPGVFVPCQRLAISLGGRWQEDLQSTHACSETQYIRGVYHRNRVC